MKSLVTATGVRARTRTRIRRSATQTNATLFDFASRAADHICLSVAVCEPPIQGVPVVKRP